MASVMVLPACGTDSGGESGAVGGDDMRASGTTSSSVAAPTTSAPPVEYVAADEDAEGVSCTVTEQGIVVEAEITNSGDYDAEYLVIATLEEGGGLPYKEEFGPVPVAAGDTVTVVEETGIYQARDVRCGAGVEKRLAR